MNRRIFPAVPLLLLMLFGSAQARLTIQVTGGVEGAQPIAVVPFESSGLALAEDVSAIIAADLARTGRFKAMPRRDMLATPSRPEDVDLRDWSLLGMVNLVIGEVVTGSGGGYQINYTLFDVYKGDQLVSQSVPSTAAGLRLAAHRIADEIYERLTGTPGVFATRIAYVTSERRQGGQTRTILKVADSDGHSPLTIVSSPEPIMSPAWSPDGRRIAYVSFENRRPAIYVQDLVSGRRDLVASYDGINGSPAFSPDGSQLAMTLSKEGSPDIFVLDLVSRQLNRITDHYAIDTEPSWSPDGSHLIFTSDRGGSPQIYKVGSLGGPVQRLTFENDYNGRASYSPDGRYITLVTRVNGQFRIGLLDLDRRYTRVLSHGNLDESPSFAPNGGMVIYATQHQGRGVLAATPINGGVGQRLSQDSGEVREPAWSPFLR